MLEQRSFLNFSSKGYAATATDPQYFLKRKPQKKLEHVQLFTWSNLEAADAIPGNQPQLCEGMQHQCSHWVHTQGNEATISPEPCFKNTLPADCEGFMPTPEQALGVAKRRRPAGARTTAGASTYRRL